MIKVGDKAEVSRIFLQQDINDYISLSGYDEVLENVPEPLLAGMISDILGTKLPGSGTMYMKQNTHFHTEAPVGKEIVASVRVTRIREDKQLVNLRTCCYLSEGAKGHQVLTSGEALVMFPGVAESRAAESRAAESRAAESRAAESRAAESRAAESKVSD